MALSRQRVLEIIKQRKHRGESLGAADLALEIGCSISTVWNALRDLKAAGKIQTIQRGRARTKTIYEVID